MNAYMGLRISEWEDGQVDIGLAVCPTTRKSAPVIGCYWTKDTQFNNDGDYILPKSAAFIMRPATSHYHKSSDGCGGGYNITYAHQPQTGISELGIMLTSTSAAQDQEQGKGQHSGSCSTSQSDGQEVATGMNSVGSEDDDTLADPDPATSQLELQEVKQSLEREDEIVARGKANCELSGEEEAVSRLKSPQDTQSLTIGKEANLELEESDSRKERETSEFPTEEQNLLQKSGGGSAPVPIVMKRVSWLEDIEKFSGEEKPTRNNSEENNKRESVRKSNGGGGKSRNRSPNKKQVQRHGFHPDDTNYHDERYKAEKRNSGDKSRIPVIATGGDYLPSKCDFYRRQMLRECCLHENNYTPPSMAENWYGYTSLQRYAGQKVMQKLATEQKRLEEDISNRRKTEIWILGSDLDDFAIASPTVTIRKKTTRLKPIQI